MNSVDKMMNETCDRVFIEGLEVITVIGVYDWEAQIKQKLIIDIEAAWDHKMAGKSDDLSHCLNYADVSEHIILHLTRHKFKLIERVAEEVASIILTVFNVSWVKVKISKPNAVLQARNVAVQIVRIK